MESQTDIQQRYFQHLREEEKEELAANADIIESFKQHCKNLGIKLTDDSFRYIQRIGIVATHPNLLGYLCTDFSKDKEGLVSFNYLNNRFKKRTLANGFLYADNFMLMAHPYFRRGLYLNNNFAPRFIEYFWHFNEPGIDSYISLDYDRVRVNVDDSIFMEFDTWYGALFKKNISDISDGVIKLAPPGDFDDFTNSFLFGDTHSFDIKWQTKKGIKSFQAEEFKNEKCTIDKEGEEFYPARYIHAEFDMGKNTFRHFDGAIHFYTADEYFSRRDSDFNYNSKNSHHIKTPSEKLFKMNGNISIDNWMKFSSQFFTGNPLVNEYFEGEYPDQVSEILKAMKNRSKE